MTSGALVLMASILVMVGFIVAAQVIMGAAVTQWDDVHERRNGDS